MSAPDFTAFTTKQLLEEVSRRSAETKESVRLGLLEQAKRTITHGYKMFTAKGEEVFVTDLPPNMILALNKILNDAPDTAFRGSTLDRLSKKQAELRAEEADLTQLPAMKEHDLATGDE